MSSKSADRSSPSHSNHSSHSADDSSFIGIKTGCGNLNIRTERGRNLHFMQMVLLPLLPIVALIVQNCVTMESVIRYQMEVTRVNDGVHSTVSLGSLVAAAQMERLSVAYWIFTNGSNLSAIDDVPDDYNERYIDRSNLSRVYANTDRVVAELPAWPSVPRQESDLFESPQHFQIRLKDFRDQLDVSDTKIRDKIEFYTSITTPLIRKLTASTSTTNTPGLWQLLEAYKSIIQALENLGRSAIFGLYYYGRGHLDQGSLFQYVRFWTIAHSGIKTSGGFSTSGKAYLKVLRARAYMQQVLAWDDEIRENGFINGSVEVADEYLQAMGRYMQDLRKMQTSLREEIQSTVRIQLKNADSEEAISIAVLVLVLSISPVIILLVRKATYMVQVFSDTLAEKMNQLKVEKKRSDRLLYQMLPVVVAKQLKQNKQVPAESFESATVYFSDIVGFEELCADSSPLQIVQLLNMQYRVFDSRLEQYNVYKVETIGDAYMVVSGLPKRIGHRHAEEIACMALDLRHSVQSIPIPHKPGQWLQIRAGVNTGPVVAGVVGTKMPRYCLFGDTVNTASRMETTCDPMRIQISLSTRMALFTAGGFIMEFRGYVDVKGKGEMSTYWLEGRDGLQLQDVNLAGTSADEDGISNPAFMHMVDDLHDSPEQKQVEKEKK